MNFTSSLIACLSYIIITILIFTITWGLSKHLFEKIKIYYELVLGVALGVLSLFGVIIISLLMSKDKNLQLSILLPIFLFWTCLLFISPYSSIGVLSCNLIALLLFPKIFPEYFGQIEGAAMISIVVLAYSVTFILFFISLFYKKITKGLIWSVTTFFILLSGFVSFMPIIKDKTALNNFGTLLLWLGVSYLAYAYLTVVNQVHTHAIKLQNIVRYEDQYYLNSASAHEQILNNIWKNKIRYGIYLNYYISNFEKFETKVNTNIKETIVSEISSQAYNLFSNKFSGSIFFKPNYKNFGVFIPLMEHDQLADKEKKKVLSKEVELIIKSITSDFFIENYRVSVKIKSVMSFYGLHSNNLDTLLEYNNLAQSHITFANEQVLNEIQPQQITKQKNRNKKMLSLNEIVALNHCSVLFEPIYFSGIKDFFGYNLNNMIEGSEVNSSLFEENKNIIENYGLQSLFTRYLALYSIKTLAKYKIKDKKLFLSYDIGYFTSPEFDFQDFITKINLYKINKKNLVICFDITQEVVNKNYLEKNINLCMEKGLKIAVTNFGALGTDFSLLEFYKPTYIFLEGDIVKKINLIKENEAILLNCIAIANKLKAKLIAQRVDTYMIYKTLKSKGVKYFSGDLIGSSSEPTPLIGTELRYLLNK